MPRGAKNLGQRSGNCQPSFLPLAHGCYGSSQVSALREMVQPADLSPVTLIPFFISCFLPSPIGPIQTHQTDDAQSCSC